MILQIGGGTREKVERYQVNVGGLQFLQTGFYRDM